MDAPQTGPPAFDPIDPAPVKMRETLPVVVVHHSKLRSRRDNLLLYHNALTAGDPVTIAKARKDREAEDLADQQDEGLHADDAWVTARDTAFRVASEEAWVGMSESDIARERPLSLAPLPPAAKVDKRMLFPRPSDAELEAMRNL